MRVHFKDIKIGDKFPTKKYGDVEILKIRTNKSIQVKFINTDSIQYVRLDRILDGTIKDVLLGLKIGSILPTNNYGDVEILKIYSSRNVEIRFINTGYIRSTTMSDIGRGTIRDKIKGCIVRGISVGDIFPTTYYGNVEILEIKSSKNIKIKFINTGYIRRCIGVSLRKGKIKDTSIAYPIKVGDILPSKNYGYFYILSINTAKSIKVKFINTGYVIKSTAWLIRKGAVDDNLYPKLYGRGYLGCGPIEKKSNQVWHGMMRRCYDPYFLINNTSYIDAEVCSEWHNYSNFKIWFDCNYSINGELDKDLLIIGNKLYSPDTCAYIGRTLNRIKPYMELRINSGVLKVGTRYKPNLRELNPRRGNIYFDTEVNATNCYRRYRLRYLLNILYNDLVIKSKRVRALIETNLRMHYQPITKK